MKDLTVKIFAYDVNDNKIEWHCISEFHIVEQAP